MSRWMGRLSSLPLPTFLRVRLLGAFGRFFGVDFTEINEPLHSFRRLQDFFIRELKPGLRVIEEGELVSPCDGAFGQCGQIDHGVLLQIKGKSYTLAELLGEHVPEFDNAHYATIYLSPRDYHRFHAPCDAKVVKARYIPGHLWPVNPWAVKNINKLFCVNERIVCWLDSDTILVAVGATMVGKVKLKFDATLTTNVRKLGVVTREYGANAPALKKGDELGHFEFGSTVVLVTKKALKDPLSGTVRLGQNLV